MHQPARPPGIVIWCHPHPQRAKGGPLDRQIQSFGEITAGSFGS
jgi:hypothetical protein